MSSANASVLHFVASSTVGFSAQHPANVSTLHIVTLQFLCLIFTKCAFGSRLPLCYSQVTLK